MDVAWINKIEFLKCRIFYYVFVCVYVCMCKKNMHINQVEVKTNVKQYKPIS